MNKKDQIDLIKKKFPRPKLGFGENWFKEENKVTLTKYINKYCNKKNSIVVELGSWKGRSGSFIADKLNDDSLVICIDLFGGDTCIGVADPYNIYGVFLLNTTSNENKIIPICRDGREGIKMLAEMKIKPDLIYLDMDHKYESVKGDLNMIYKYFPRVPIVGDDPDAYAGTKKALFEFIVEKKVPYLDIDRNCYAIIYDHLPEFTYYSILKEHNFERHSRELIFQFKQPKFNQAKIIDLVLIINTEYEEKQLKSYLKNLTQKMKSYNYNIILIKNKADKVGLNMRLIRLLTKKDFNSLLRPNANIVIASLKNYKLDHNLVQYMTIKATNNLTLVMDLNNVRPLYYRFWWFIICQKKNLDKIKWGTTDNRHANVKLFYNNIVKTKQVLDTIHYSKEYLNKGHLETSYSAFQNLNEKIRDHYKIPKEIRYKIHSTKEVIPKCKLLDISYEIIKK